LRRPSARPFLVLSASSYKFLTDQITEEQYRSLMDEGR